MGFFSRKKKVPDFQQIKTYPNREKYFARIKRWTWLDEERIYVMSKTESGQVRMITLDFWPQEIYLDATGDVMIKDFLNVLVKQYQDSDMQVPDELDLMMIENLEILKDEGLIVFSDDPIAVEEEILNPTEIE